MSGTDFHHIPVLPKEVMQYLQPERGGRFVDGTLGGGGHTRLILEANAENEVLGIDRDKEALKATGTRLAEFGERFHACHGEYANMADYVKAAGWDQVDGILLDIGVSSHQLDTAVRGFSYREDGPLDMRMNQQYSVSASTILNQWSEDELVRIFKDYGEVRKARQVARAVVQDRQDKPFERTQQFAELVDRIDRNPGRRKSSAMLYFQALRIAVNDELGQLEQGLKQAMRLLKVGGRLVVISFHSLEDRMVKQFFANEAAPCTCPPEFPVCICNKQPTVKVLTRKAEKACQDELAENSRSSCARLRAAQKILEIDDDLY